MGALIALVQHACDCNLIGETRPRTKVVYYEPLPEWGWLLAGGAYDDELRHDGIVLRNINIGAALAMVVILSALLYLMTRRLEARPLQTAMQVFERIGEGHYDNRITTDRRDEKRGGSPWRGIDGHAHQAGDDAAATGAGSVLGRRRVGAFLEPSAGILQSCASSPRPFADQRSDPVSEQRVEHFIWRCWSPRPPADQPRRNLSPRGVTGGRVGPGGQRLGVVPERVWQPRSGSMRRLRVSRVARRLLALQSGPRARGLPLQRPPLPSAQPGRRPRLSGVVRCPHPLSTALLVTAV